MSGWVIEGFLCSGRNAAGKKGFAFLHPSFFRLLFALFVLIFFLSACGGSSHTKATPVITFDGGVSSVSKTSADLPFTIEATVTGTPNGPVPGTVTYTSSDPSLATVDSATGTVTLIGGPAASGTVIITASTPEDANYSAASASYSVVIGNQCPTPDESTFDATKVVPTEMTQDFSNAALDATAWTIKNQTAGDITVANGNVTIKNANATGGWHNSGLATAASYSRALGDIAVETDFTTPVCTGNSVGIFYGANASGAADNIYFYFAGSLARLGHTTSGAFVLSPGTVCVANHKLRIKLELPASGGARAYWYDTTKGETDYPLAPQLSLTAEQATTDNQPIAFTGYNSTTYPATLDNLRITQTGIATPPSHVLATPADGKVLVQWDVGSGNTVEMKPSYCENWRTVATVSRENVRGYTVTGLTNGYSYDFRVRTPGHLAPSVTVSVSPSASSSPAYLNQVLSTGQSLSIGSKSLTTLTSVQPYQNKMLNSTNDGFLPLRELVTLPPSSANPDPLAPGVVPRNETISSALYNTISAEAGSSSSYYQGIVSPHGIGGTQYSGIKKNGATAAYEAGQTQMNTAMSLAITAGSPFRVVATTLVHGESDQGNGITAAQ